MSLGPYTDSNAREDTPLQRPHGGAPVRVRRGALLVCFNCVASATVVLALLGLAAQVLALMYLHELSLVEIGIRLYTMVLCVGVALTEMEWTRTLREFKLLQNWISRGLIYIFVGLLILEEQNEKYHLQGKLSLFLFVVGTGICGMGALYSLMGVLCMKRIRDQRMSRYIQLLSHAEVQEQLRDSISV